MLTVLVALTAITALSTVSLLIGGVYLSVKLRTIARSFVEPAAEGQQSAFAAVITAIASQFAEVLFLRVKQHLGGVQSTITRQENRIKGELIESQLSDAHPAIGFLLKALPPNVQKAVRSPAGAAALIGLLGGGFGNTNGHRETQQKLEL